MSRRWGRIALILLLKDDFLKPSATAIDKPEVRMAPKGKGPRDKWGKLK